MQSQLEEYRKRQRERFRAASTGNGSEAQVRAVDLTSSASTSSKPAAAAANEDVPHSGLEPELPFVVEDVAAPLRNATLDAIAKALREGDGEKSVLDMLLPDSDEEIDVSEPPTKVARAQVPVLEPTLSVGAANALRSRMPPTGSLRLASWNIDGLDEWSERHPEDLVFRATAVCEELCSLGVSVALLQEVVPETLVIIHKLLDPFYHVFVPTFPKAQYFVAILLHRAKMAPLLPDATYEEFPGSRMGRGLLSIEAACKGDEDAPLFLATTHLESSKNCRDERGAQLLQCFRKLANASANCPDVQALLGGDLNLRDQEAKKGVRDAEASSRVRFPDAWELCGSSPSERFTWNPNENSNCPISNDGTGSLPKCRFDRIFAAASSTQTTAAAMMAAMRWNPSKFELIGNVRLDSGRFASDHWGILTEWQKRSTATT